MAMRLMLAFALTVSATPALAWTAFEDDRFGYRLELPPGYSLSYETEQRNARFFHNADGHFIALWASREPGVSFEDDVADRLWADQAEGWTISYERFTSDWASYSGTKDDEIRYVRAVNLCGHGTAYFLIDYAHALKDQYDPLVNADGTQYAGDRLLSARIVRLVVSLGFLHHPHSGRPQIWVAGLARVFARLG